MTWLFLYGLVAPLQGPFARALNGLDLSWLAGMLTGGLLYYVLYKLGMATPRAREAVGDASRIDRSTEA
jgi:nucleobase:cation symporter-1, NCS1 family